MHNVFRAIIGIAHRLGVSPLMHRTRRCARKFGQRLRFRPRSIRWELGNGHVLLLPVNQPYHTSGLISSSPRWLPRLVLPPDGSNRIIDLRKEALFRLPSGRHIWLPGSIELVDTCAGYFARGAPRPGDVVVDVGAFCGAVTIEAAILVGPAGHVFALEPDPANIALLRRNLELHGLNNVTLLPCALWNRTARLAFDADGTCGSSIRFEDKSGPPATEILALSPADLFARIGRVPDFIKMDIEGAEVEVVSAMIPHLEASEIRVRLAIASYHQRDHAVTHELIEPVLRAAGMHVETGYPDHLTTWAWKP